MSAEPTADEGERTPRLVIVGNLEIDLSERRVRMKNDVVSLKPKEFEVLRLLAMRKGTVVVRSVFMTELFPDSQRGSNVVEVHMTYLRKKLARANDGIHYIETIYGKGYVLKSPRS